MSGRISLESGIEALIGKGVQIPDGVAERLAHYLGLLDKWNRTYNLTAIRDTDRMVTHHLLDALAILPHFPEMPALRLLDIGSGAGLPGIPLAIARPGWHVTVLDSNHKKGAFMQQAAAELGTANVQVQVCRVEDFSPAEPYDAVVSRAFSDLATFAQAGVRLLAPGGRLLAMKGIFPHEEIRELPENVRVRETPVLNVPGLEAERHLVVLEPA